MPAKNTSGIVTPKETDTAVRTATAQLRDLLEGSGQAIYLYQDDHHKACNQRFAELLGYTSPDSWATVHTSFPSTFVAPKSQEVLVEAYQAAVNDGVATTVPITWKRKDGKTVDTDVILVPIDVEGRRLALHFITA
ncbi:MAG TPA: PAS domain-containing protein [Candidatus Thermoplasmatota archaeon]|nr:PAS domain-containing protein [Candidatus Thermoplasmatota archaeon]